MSTTARRATISDEDREFATKFYDKLYLNLDDLTAGYNELAPIYDRVASIVQFDSPKRLSKELAKLLKHRNLEEQKILDVGCGTGSLGKSLVEEGFKNIDGLDIPEKFLDMCKETKCYKKLYQVPLTANPTPGIEENTYDIAISTGSYIVNHISMDTLFELTRIVKPGGYIFYTLHDPNYTMDYMNWHGKIMKEKKAELISMTLEPYKLESRNDFKLSYGYFVLFKVL